MLTSIGWCAKSRGSRPINRLAVRCCSTHCRDPEAKWLSTAETTTGRLGKQKVPPMTSKLGGHPKSLSQCLMRGRPNRRPPGIFSITLPPGLPLSDHWPSSALIRSLVFPLTPKLEVILCHTIASTGRGRRRREGEEGALMRPAESDIHLYASPVDPGRRNAGKGASSLGWDGGKRVEPFIPLLSLASSALTLPPAGIDLLSLPPARAPTMWSPRTSYRPSFPGPFFAYLCGAALGGAEWHPRCSVLSIVCPE
ncbi:hypothetical protein LZ30DRAFT_703965 [Colletotrichum cereale]|nr:hypothetical protein LZ30DRAFT_703965 [Colletotrichum cereale]